MHYVVLLARVHQRFGAEFSLRQYMVYLSTYYLRHIYGLYVVPAGTTCISNCTGQYLGKTNTFQKH